jgi:hypothetical protein
LSVAKSVGGYETPISESTMRSKLESEHENHRRRRRERGADVTGRVSMAGKSEGSKTRRTVRSLTGWAGTATLVQTWAAVASMIELQGGGIRRLVLTLPVAIIAVLDSWQELRTPPIMADDGSPRTNNAQKATEV